MKNVLSHKRLWVSSAAVLVAAGVLSGCGDSNNKDNASASPSAPASGSSSAAAAQAAGGAKALKKVTFAYAGGTCEAPIYAAIEKGFFKEEGLDVTLVQQDFETLKSGIASGKVDGTVGNFAWFKPIEQGLDVKLTGGLHAGCIQLVAPGDSGIKSVADLKGKIIGVDVIGGGPQITLSIALKQQGLDPQKDVEWRAYPSQQLATAAEKGEIAAFIVWDPAAQQAIDDKKYVRLLSNGHDEPFKSGYCCYSVISGKVAEEDPEKAASITRALLKAAEWVGTNAHETAEIETNKKYVSADAATNEKLLAGYHWKPGVKSAQESAKFFIKYQKELGILDASTDETELYNRVFFAAIPDFNGR
ncbi:ABC transporter substrate-binding protein [Cohnella faecalis]|uniref:ABC transporter substrate-binding protein n=1 Tax=Cohnella faecalis TaxID=2315694 RepID=A0A398CQ16_9BACL|nr:ABC transporter substrate-binding protein [Cohnella faecalis]RIE01927.1 ABC transporter substrate-binding protein [Cohnella faecalis]